MLFRFVACPLVLIGLAIVAYKSFATPILGPITVLGSAAVGASGLTLKRNRGER